MQSNMELAIEIIGQAMDLLFLPEDNANEKPIKAVNSLLNTVSEGYVLVQWPESQEFMEEKWFDDEAILALGSEDKIGSSAYFIPIKRVL